MLSVSPLHVYGVSPRLTGELKTNAPFPTHVMALTRQHLAGRTRPLFMMAAEHVCCGSAMSA
jgi:hypothetical protein